MARGKPEVAAVMVDINRLAGWDKNPRKNEAAVGPVAESLRRFGFASPVIARLKTGPTGLHEVIAGHTRLKAAARLGMSQVPVRFMDLTPAEAHALSLADNRLGELAEWDDALLAQVLGELRSEDVSLAGLGWSDDELSKLGTGGASGPAGTPPGEDDIPEPPEKPVSRRGDLWHLGRHRVLCGDSTSADDVAKLMNGESADFAFTSPPYNIGIPYEGDADDDWGGRVDHRPIAEYLKFVSSMIGVWVKHMGAGRMFGLNIGVKPRLAPHRVMVAFEDAGLTFVRSTIWKKVGVPLPSYHYTLENPKARNYRPHQVHELVALFSRGPVEYGSPVELDPLIEGDVFTLHQSAATVDLENDPTGTRTAGTEALKKRSRKVHPAPFPVALPAAFILHLADKGALVVDPFMGSGSTLMACEKTGRRAAGTELAPKYVDVIIRRWQTATGGTAKHESGKTYDQMKKARRA